MAEDLRNLPARSPAERIAVEAIELVIEGRSPYPDKAMFIDAEEPWRAPRSREPSTKARQSCSRTRTAARGCCTRRWPTGRSMPRGADSDSA